MHLAMYTTLLAILGTVAFVAINEMSQSANAIAN